MGPDVGQGCGKLGLRVADGLFLPALQMDGEGRPEGRSCRTGAPVDRNPKISQGPGQVNGQVWNWQLT